MRRLLSLSAACSLLALTTAASAQLVTNGGFETGDFTGWTQAGNTGFTGVSGTFGGVAPAGGSFQAFFGPVGSLGSISQAITTTPGESYSLGFDLFNFGGTPNEFVVTIGGVTVEDDIDMAAQPYTHNTHAFTAAGSSTEIAFSFRQDPSYFLLDNVNVIPRNPGGNVPVPAAPAVVLIGGSVFGLCFRRRRSA